MNMNSIRSHIMALVTFLTLIPLVYFIPDLIAPYLPENNLVNVVVAVGIIVPIVSYCVAPLTARFITKYESKA